MIIMKLTYKEDYKSIIQFEENVFENFRQLFSTIKSIFESASEQK